MFKISGAYCAVLTPLKNNLSINNNLHLRHCQSLMQKGLDGLTIFGTNGEASSFSVSQKIQTIEFLLENRIDASNLLIGSGSSSLEDAITLTKFSAKVGTKASLLINKLLASIRFSNKNSIVCIFIFHVFLCTNLWFFLFHILIQTLVPILKVETPLYHLLFFPKLHQAFLC